MRFLITAAVLLVIPAESPAQQIVSRSWWADRGNKPLWVGPRLSLDRNKPVIVTVPAGYGVIEARDYLLQPDRGYLTDPVTKRQFVGPSGSWSGGHRNSVGWSVSPSGDGGYNLTLWVCRGPNQFCDQHQTRPDGAWWPTGWWVIFPKARQPITVRQ